MDLQTILEYKFLSNTVHNYLYALALFFALSISFSVFKSIILGRLKKMAQATSTTFDDQLVAVFERIQPIFYNYTAFYLASKYLKFSPTVDEALHAIFIVIITLQAIISLTSFVEYILRKIIFKTAGHSIEENKTAFQGIKLIVQIVIWIIGLLMILSNLGINITSLAASLGIGGIAIALAIQNILSDIFSSFSIYFDKPFEVGDFIIVGTDTGTVEKIGLKTTRLITLQGEELIISNKELTSARIQNFKKMEKRRVVFAFGLTYDTSSEKLKEASKLAADIIERTDNAELDRVNFKEFGDFSLNFEAVYTHQSGDYAEYMRTREKINLAIKDEFSKAGLEMAFPTQTLHLVKEAA